MNRRQFLTTATAAATTFALAPKVFADITFHVPESYHWIPPDMPNYAALIEGFVLIEAQNLVVENIYINPADRERFLDVFTPPQQRSQFDHAYDIPHKNVVGFLHGATVHVRDDIDLSEVRMESCTLWPDDEDTNPRNVMTVNVRHNKWTVKEPRPEYVGGFGYYEVVRIEDAVLGKGIQTTFIQRPL